MDNIIFWIIVGTLTGFLAKSIIHIHTPTGTIGDILLGLVGAVMGGLLLNVFVGNSAGGLLNNIGVAFVGAFIFLYAVRALSKYPHRNYLIRS